MQKKKLDIGFQKIPRKLIFDSSISDRARFLYCYMAAKPEGWSFFLEPMAEELGYNIKTLKKYIEELVKAKWITSCAQKREGGLFSSKTFIINNIPHEMDDQKMDDQKMDDQKMDDQKMDDQKMDDNNRIDKDNIDKERKYKEKEEETSSSSKKKIFNFKKALVDLGVDPIIASEWIEVRKNKKASQTETAFERTKREIEKSGASPNECITMAVEHSWQGFFAKWYFKTKENEGSVDLFSEQQVSKDLVINGQIYR